MILINNLRGAVYSKFKNVAEFSKSLGWSYNKANRIINGRQQPDAREMIAIAHTLGIQTQKEFMQIFSKINPQSGLNNFARIQKGA